MSAMIPHPFVLLDGRVITIELPDDVTPDEIDRLCNMLHTLPTEPPSSGRPS